MLSRKANVMISFSWIFMIIIGGFFLILSYNIVSKYQANQEAKYDIELRQALRSILNNVGRTEGIEENSLRPIGNIFSNKDVEILCVDNVPLLSINEKLDGENQFLKNYPTFMTKISEGKVSFSYIAVESLRVPFKTTNLLAMVSKKNLIVLDTNSDITEKVNDKFTKGSYKELEFWTMDFSTINTVEFQDNIKKMNLNSIMFVSDMNHNLPIGFLAELKPASYQVKIDDKNGYGTINYFDKDGEIESFNYIDFDDSFSLPTMAIFSKPETFKCSYELVIENTINTYQFYIDKANLLSERSLNEKLCSDISVKYDSSGKIDGRSQKVLYDSMSQLLESAKLEVETQRFNNVENVNTILGEIDRKSRDIESYNCMYIY